MDNQREDTELNVSEGTSLRESLESKLSPETKKEPESPQKEAKVEVSKPAESKKSATKSLGKSLRDNLEGKTAPITPPGQVGEAPIAPTMIAPPADMKAEEKEAFSKLSPEMQAYVSRRAYEYQSDHTRKIAQVQEIARRYQDLDQIITPELQNEYARKQVSVPQLVQNAIAWDREFARDRISAAKDYLEQWGIDPEELLNAPSYAPEPQYLTREEAQSLAEEQARKIIEEQQQGVLLHQNWNAVESFIKSKPLFSDPQTSQQAEEAIANEIVGLKAQGFQGSTSQLLEAAYERVSKLHPVFSNLLNQANQRQEAERQAAEAEKARLASRSIKGSPGQGTPQVKSGSLREALERNLSR